MPETVQALKGAADALKADAESRKKVTDSAGDILEAVKPYLLQTIVIGGPMLVLFLLHLRNRKRISAAVPKKR